MRSELFYKAWKARTSKMSLNFTANSFIFGHINRGIAPGPFSANLAGRELPKCVWAQRQTVSFLDANRENAPRAIFIKLERRKLPKCVWTSQQTASFLDTQIVELRPEPFLQNLQAENFQNASEFHGKQIRFWRINRENAPRTFI